MNSKLLPSSTSIWRGALVCSISRDGSPSGSSPFSRSVHSAALLHIVLQAVAGLIV